MKKLYKCFRKAYKYLKIKVGMKNWKRLHLIVDNSFEGLLDSLDNRFVVYGVDYNNNGINFRTGSILNRKMYSKSSLDI